MVIKLKSYFKALLLAPFKVFFWIKHRYTRFKDSISDFFHHFQILKEANISLGKYHILQGNMKDADLRFYITDKVFAPNNPENLYWYSWSKILQKDYASALRILKEDNIYDKIGLYNYIANMSSVSEIPTAIIDEYNALTNNYRDNRYFSDKVNLFEKFTQEIVKFIPEFNKTENEKEQAAPYTILDVGSYPAWTEELSQFLPESSIIRNISLDEISNVGEKYNLVLAFDSLSYTIKMGESLQKMKQALSAGGIFAVLLPKAPLTKLDPSLNSFLFYIQYLTDQLELAQFEILSISSVALDKMREFHIIIAK